MKEALGVASTILFVFTVSVSVLPSQKSSRSK